MLPYTPLHYLLFSDSPEIASEWSALVMTSGNLSEEPIVVGNPEAMLQLGGVADWFLLHNRDIATRVDDSVVRNFEGRERVLRRSRGFVPQTIDLGIELEEVLAFGGELKNTFCLTKGRYAILSQHIGDLENYETMQFFEETLANLKHIFRVVPRAAVYDLHPGYMSTRMALASGIERKIGVQHHHAHIASCMAENYLQGRVLGRGHGRHWIRDRWHGLGRRISGCGLRRFYAAGAFAQRSATRRGRGGAATMADGVQLPARCFRATDARRGARLSGDRREADGAGGHHAHAADPNGRNIFLWTALRCRRCAFGRGSGGDV